MHSHCFWCQGHHCPHQAPCGLFSVGGLHMPLCVLRHLWGFSLLISGSHSPSLLASNLSFLLGPAYLPLFPPSPCFSLCSYSPVAKLYPLFPGDSVVSQGHCLEYCLPSPLPIASRVKSQLLPGAPLYAYTSVGPYTEHPSSQLQMTFMDDRSLA